MKQGMQKAYSEAAQHICKGRQHIQVRIVPLRQTLVIHENARIHVSYLWCQNNESPKVADSRG